MHRFIARTVVLSALALTTGPYEVYGNDWVVQKEEALPRDIYVGYDYYKRGCQEYLQQLNIKIDAAEDRSVNHKLRNALLPVIVQGPENISSNTKSFNTWIALDERTTELVDKTFVHFPRETVTESEASVSESPRSLEGEFRWLKHIEVDDIKVPDAMDASTLRDDIRKLPCVAFAEFSALRYNNVPESLDPNKQVDLVQNLRKAETSENEKWPNKEVIPNDPWFAERQWYSRELNLPNAWSVWTGPRSDGPGDMAGVVAVTDTGCDTAHPDMQGRYWVNSKEICGNGIDDDNNGYVDDCMGWNFVGDNNDLKEVNRHGTSVSGAITETANNNIALAGTCWSCKIMCLRVGITALHIGAFVEAVNYAKGYGVKIVNFSAGGGASNLEQRVIESARQSGVIVVVAAGNSACDLDSNLPCTEFGYPARYDFDNIVSVGSTARNATLSGFSNIGRISVDVFAPGTQIYLPTDSGYKQVSGTSVSAPFTSGVLALVKSKYPGLNYKQAIASVTKTCRRSSVLVGKGRCPGVVDAYAALEYARQISIGSRPSVDDNSAIESIGAPSNSRWGSNSVVNYIPYKPRNPCWPFNCAPQNQTPEIPQPAH